MTTSRRARELRVVAASLLGREGEGGAAPSAQVLRALTGYELRLTVGRGESLLVTFLIPVAVLLFFSTVELLPGDRGQRVDTLLPGSMALAVVATCLVGLSIATAYERAYGVLKRLAGTPASAAQRIGAKVGALLAIESVQAILLIGIAVLFLGWRPGPAASLPLLVAALAAGTVTFASAGILLAGTLRAETTLAVANALFLIALLLGDVVVPVDHLPTQLAAIAAALPVAALVDLIRVALDAGPGDPARSGVVLAIWGAGAAVGAIRWTRWD